MSTEAEQTPAAPPSPPPPGSPPAGEPSPPARAASSRGASPEPEAAPPAPRSASPGPAPEKPRGDGSAHAAEPAERADAPDPAEPADAPESTDATESTDAASAGATASAGTADPPGPAAPSSPPPPHHPPRPYAPPVPAVPPKPVGAPLHMASVLPSDIPRTEPEPPAERRGVPRTVAAAAALITGLGLVVGAATGSWLSDGPQAQAQPGAYEVARDLWHTTPVDKLFPPRLEGDGAGPGGADRTWVRVAVAPPGGCTKGFDPALARELARVGCEKLLRATYADVTRSSVTTVGLVFTEAGSAKTGRFEDRFEEKGFGERQDMLPRAYGAKTGPAAGFGDEQRAAWTVRVLSDVPVVVYAVTGFADGRATEDPEPAADAVHPAATTAPAQAGLGHDAEGIADRIERGLRKNSARATESPR